VKMHREKSGVEKPIELVGGKGRHRGGRKMGGLRVCCQIEGFRAHPASGLRRSGRASVGG